MRVVVLTTSYPRGVDDVAGAFVRDAVEHLREAGLDVDVVSPASFRHFGLAYGHGIVGNLRRRPWRVLLLPLFLAAYARAARLRPLAWGMTAALVATLVANLFYLTMTFYYFYVFAVLAVALPVVFGRATRS